VTESREYPVLNDPHYRASKYPYHLPERSFVMEKGNHTVVDHDEMLENLEGRVPVLAVGSNMSPQQLARKFPGPEDNIIPVTKINLRHFDSVYSSHFSGYGSIPATLFPSPDTEVSLFITWLDSRQEEYMHETEVLGDHYHFCRINKIEAKLDNGPELDHMYAYLSCKGAMSIKEEPVALSAVSAQNRRWKALHQHEIQDHARINMAPDLSLAGFMDANIYNSDQRNKHTNILRDTVIPFSHDDIDIITT
jgi:hypothetical protein